MRGQVEIFLYFVFLGLISPWFTPGLPGYVWFLILSLHAPSQPQTRGITKNNLPKSSICRGITKNHLPTCETAFSVYFMLKKYL